MGVLFEPAHGSWCTHWHRDWGYNVPHMKLDRFFEAIMDMTMFNQLNGALFDDHSLWIVPGSHNRKDSEQERAAFPPSAHRPDRYLLRKCRRRCGNSRAAHIRRGCRERSRCICSASDVAFYRSCQWHIGPYVPSHQARHSPRWLLWPGRSAVAGGRASMAGGSTRN